MRLPHHRLWNVVDRRRGLPIGAHRRSGWRPERLNRTHRDGLARAASSSGRQADGAPDARPGDDTDDAINPMRLPRGRPCLEALLADVATVDSPRPRRRPAAVERGGDPLMMLAFECMPEGTLRERRACST